MFELKFWFDIKQSKFIECHNKDFQVVLFYPLSLTNAVLIGNPDMKAYNCLGRKISFFNRHIVYWFSTKDYPFPENFFKVNNKIVIDPIKKRVSFNIKNKRKEIVFTNKSIYFYFKNKNVLSLRTTTFIGTQKLIFDFHDSKILAYLNPNEYQKDDNNYKSAEYILSFIKDEIYARKK